ncbi:RES domain-containing protein [Thalassotalea euphylliae]|uniref:RES domain-containing protein n=1 Tax=Thalassotalea euphylliae TaxID=1655234 RepID=UPI003641F93C
MLFNKDLLPLKSQYKKNVYRIVETQEYAATSKLVDDFEEQHLLEQLLDGVKPPYRPDTIGRHYLIATPFRYPPLKYGSRFGDTTMPSYFYGCEEVDTTLAECAFYRFVFLSDMATPYSKPIRSEHMTFSVYVESNDCFDLTAIIDPQLSCVIKSPSDYRTTQAIGKYATLELGVDTLRYTSARSTSNGINVAISQPSVIKSQQPENQQLWQCRSYSETISFSGVGTEPINFYKESFLVNGQLPKLA